MNEIKNKTRAELQKILSEKKEAIRAFRFGTAGSKSKNVKMGSMLRKDVARIMTALNTNDNIGQ